MYADFTNNLLQWNRIENHRQMPWKGEKDPYRIWVSEIILQQTRVQQGTSYYQNFIKKFPDVHTLANARDEEVYKCWEGLGYYSRCKNLIETARTIRNSYHGVFPSSFHDIIRLKGIGPYTAAAISSFAFNEKHAVVDGNVQRVLARYFGITVAPNTTPGKRLFADTANKLIDESAPGEYNQAIMDFGAEICKPRNPMCASCPLSAGCFAFNNNMVQDLPAKTTQAAVRERWLYYFIIEFADSVFIRKREAKDIWRNLHEFVVFESVSENETAAIAFLNQLLQHQTFVIVAKSNLQTQLLSHQRIKGRFINVKLNHPPAITGYKLVEKNNLQAYAFPRFINAYLEENMFDMA